MSLRGSLQLPFRRPPKRLFPKFQRPVRLPRVSCPASHPRMTAAMADTSRAAAADEMQAAVAAAKKAFPEWRDTSVSARARVMFKLQALIREHTDELADVITLELGKVTADAKGDVFRGLEVVEASCGMGASMMGDSLGQVSYDMDTYMIRQPLGVCAGITPFNFPAMIPLWMFPVAVTSGNTFVMKPSEIDPGPPMMLAKLAKEAGLPDGVVRCEPNSVQDFVAPCDSMIRLQCCAVHCAAQHYPWHQGRSQLCLRPPGYSSSVFRGLQSCGPACAQAGDGQWEALPGKFGR